MAVWMLHAFVVVQGVINTILCSKIFLQVLVVVTGRLSKGAFA